MHQHTSVLAKITDWKQFERFCADLLECEGFLVQSEPHVDRSGIDIRVIEEYHTTHDPNRVIRMRWRVQCKHYAVSGSNLSRKDVEEALYSFDATRSPDEGLFLIVSTDYTEPAKEVIDQYLENHPTAKITIWNQRQIIAKLDRHPQLLRRYGITRIEPDYFSAISELSSFAPCRILFLSDQSPLAHNLASALRHSGFETVFLPFWLYSMPSRLELILGSFKESSFGLVISFLGDSFGLPMPSRLTDFVVSCHRRGTPILLYPFLAWSMRQGLYRSLTGICPVELINLQAATPVAFDPMQILGEFRRGDFRWLLKFDAFAEDQYVEYEPQDCKNSFAEGIDSRFGLSHSFEYLRPREGADAFWADTAGNPFVVAMQSDTGRTCYVNTCCHVCMSPIAVTSPLEASKEFGILQRNVLRWLLAE